MKPASPAAAQTPSREVSEPLTAASLARPPTIVVYEVSESPEGAHESALVSFSRQKRAPIERRQNAVCDETALW